MVQTGGPAEAVTAMATGKIHGGVKSARDASSEGNSNFKELLDMSKLDAEYHINGVVTTRRYLKTKRTPSGAFMRAYIEGAARGQKDKNFALKAMGKIFAPTTGRCWTRAYEMMIKTNFAIPPYPSMPGIASLIQGLEKQIRRRRVPNRKSTPTAESCGSWSRADL